MPLKVVTTIRKEDWSNSNHSKKALQEMFLSKRFVTTKLKEIWVVHLNGPK